MRCKVFILRRFSHVVFRQLLFRDRILKKELFYSLIQNSLLLTVFLFFIKCEVRHWTKHFIFVIYKYKQRRSLVHSFLVHIVWFQYYYPGILISPEEGTGELDCLGPRRSSLISSIQVNTAVLHNISSIQVYTAVPYNISSIQVYTASAVPYNISSIQVNTAVQ